MSLANQCRKFFSASSRAKGDIYHDSGFVIDPKRSASNFQAKVKGSSYKPYHVKIDWANTVSTKKLRASCDCPHYEEGNFCKHLWALLLTMDDMMVSAVVPQNLSFELIHDVGDSQEEIEFSPRPHHTSESHGKSWLKQLRRIESAALPKDDLSPHRKKSPKQRTAYFALNAPMSRSLSRPVIDFWMREELGELKPVKVSMDDLSPGSSPYQDPLDRELLALLLSSNTSAYENQYYYRYHEPFHRVDRVLIRPQLQEPLLKRLAATGRLLMTSNSHDGIPDHPKESIFFEENSWTLKLAVDQDSAHYRVSGRLFKENPMESRELSEILFTLSPDLVFFRKSIGKLVNPDHLAWISSLLRKKGILVPEADADLFVETVLSSPRVPEVRLPKKLRWKKIELQEPRVKASFTTPPPELAANRGILLTIEFNYDGKNIESFKANDPLLDSSRRRIIPRHQEFEKQTLARVAALGAREPHAAFAAESSFQVPMLAFPKVAQQLLSFGWDVEAEGKKVQRAKSFSLSVSSGIDWFDLSAKAEFAKGASATLSSLLEALKRGENFIVLGDGTLGMLPEDWLKRYAPLAELGTEQKEKIRFHRAQALLLDAWLSEEENLKVDRGFRHFQGMIRSFRGLKPKAAPQDFQCRLRPYQKEGLAWLDFLRSFGLGGILADDMGLGKTIQLLALMSQGSSGPKKKKRPALVIVPKSLVFNWLEEKEKFAPHLKAVNYTGLERENRLPEIASADLVITTYQTLRIDIEHLRKIEFGLVVADEAQAIKNEKALASKACRLIRADHKIAMTGTPVENSVSDLFSIMEFVNPGLLTGKAKMGFQSNADDRGKSLETLAKALRPVILRRTKDQVLKDLPKKTEQTIRCALGDQESKSYAELRDHYRLSLKKKIDTVGIAKSRIQVLTALLRLRQAACHPGLIDKKKMDEPSAKLESLVEQLKEATSDGHKALVFSQFTTFLRIVRRRLDREGLSYEYLDGKTRDRKARVDHFQSNPDCKVFLISLKAGGSGLNLTAADYVFMLDPWWNPAVEAQAIDRAHRIGQARKVFSYKLISQGTVEEKVLELQKKKQNLAKAIISADTGFIRQMTSEDLALLLS